MGRSSNEPSRPRRDRRLSASMMFACFGMVAGCRMPRRSAPLVQGLRRAVVRDAKRASGPGEAVPRPPFPAPARRAVRPLEELEGDVRRVRSSPRSQTRRRGRLRSRGWRQGFGHGGAGLSREASARRNPAAHVCRRGGPPPNGDGLEGHTVRPRSESLRPAVNYAHQSHPLSPAPNLLFRSGKAPEAGREDSGPRACRLGVGKTVRRRIPWPALHVPGNGPSWNFAH